MSTGSELWQKAKTLIPGGSMLLSKRAEMYLPAGWPAYFSRTSGCTVWDLDDRAYLDVGLMGVGTNILGYSHPKVDEAVRREPRLERPRMVCGPASIEKPDAALGLELPKIRSSVRREEERYVEIAPRRAGLKDVIAEHLIAARVAFCLVDHR